MYTVVACSTSGEYSEYRTSTLTDAMEHHDIMSADPRTQAVEILDDADDTHPGIDGLPEYDDDLESALRAAKYSAVAWDDTDPTTLDVYLADNNTDDPEFLDNDTTFPGCMADVTDDIPF